MASCGGACAFRCHVFLEHLIFKYLQNSTTRPLFAAAPTTSPLPPRRRGAALIEPASPPQDAEPPLEHSHYDAVNATLHARFALATWKLTLEHGLSVECLEAWHGMAELLDCWSIGINQEMSGHFWVRVLTLCSRTVDSKFWRMVQHKKQTIA